jgi:hypothetical protein
VEKGCTRHILSYLEPYGVVLARVCRAWRGYDKGFWAVICESLDLLAWGEKLGIRPTKKLSREIAKRGSLAAPQWAHANNCLWDERTCKHAATGGHLEVLQWMIFVSKIMHQRLFMRCGTCLRAAKAWGHPTMRQWIQATAVSAF